MPGPFGGAETRVFVKSLLSMLQCMMARLKQLKGQENKKAGRIEGFCFRKLSHLLDTRTSEDDTGF